MKMKNKVLLVILLLIVILGVGSRLMGIIFNEAEATVVPNEDEERVDAITEATEPITMEEPVETDVDSVSEATVTTKSTVVNPSSAVKVPEAEAHVIEPSEAKAEFEINTIDEALYSEMLGKSFKENDVIKVDALRVLTLTYYGFDDADHVGQMVVNQEVAEEVLEIFKTLYEAQYPIEKISLVDNYDADDDLSMADNNTSSFNFRVVSGSENLSKHSYGMAIDINPIQNPYVTSKGISPPEGSAYVDRSLNEKGMILEDDLCYKLFTEKGWTWGGHFKSVKDYQHFQKAFETTNK